MVFQLTDDIVFPDPRLANDSGLLAIGGDLSEERLMLAYRMGIFPWYNDDEPICWFSPLERCVLFPGKLKVSKSMQKVLRSQVFTITENKAFDPVIEYCSRVPRDGEYGTWITGDMKKAYKNLHKAGFARSVECWHKNELVGGLYGIELNRVFCGESMFSLMPNASKAAFIHLVRSNRYKLIDCQIVTSHHLTMGAEPMERNTYLDLLNKIINEQEN